MEKTKIVFFTIPRPKAKRMSGTGVMTVLLHTAFEGDRKSTSPIPQCLEGQRIAPNIPARFEHIDSATFVDGDTYKAFVTFSNSTGTRREVIELKPEAEIHDGDPLVQ